MAEKNVPSYLTMNRHAKDYGSEVFSESETDSLVETSLTDEKANPGSSVSTPIRGLFPPNVVMPDSRSLVWDPLTRHNLYTYSDPTCKQKNKFFCKFDMRKSNLSEAEGAVFLSTDMDALASMMDTQKDLIHIKALKNDFSVLVLARTKSDKFLFVQSETSRTFCMRITPDTRQEDVISDVYRNIGQQVSMDKFCLFADSLCIEKSDTCALWNLPNFSNVKIIKIKMHHVQIIYQCEPFCEKRYTIRCSNVDTLAQLKQNFLQFFSAKETPQTAISENNVWFTDKETIITEDVLQKMFRLKFIDRYAGYDFEEHSMIHLMNSDQSEINRHELYVFFQPQDAIIVKVSFKTDASRMLRRERPLVVSPRISPQQLQNEIAVLVEQEPAAIRVFIGKKKLDTSKQLDLHQALSSSNCAVTVERKQKIDIEVDITVAPLTTVLYKKLTLQLYSYDVTCDLKAKVCDVIGIDPRYAKVYMESKPLEEDKTLRENRIQDKAIVVVFPNRVFISVRTTNKNWHIVVIDDSTVTTVRDLKIFSEGLDEIQNAAHSSEIVAVFHNNVLEDHITLNSVDIHDPVILPLDKDLMERCCEEGSTQKAQASFKVVLVYSQNNCFTASSCCNDQLLIFRDKGGGCFQPVLAVYKRNRLLYDPDESHQHIQEEVEYMVNERRKTSSQIEGIRKCTYYETEKVIELGKFKEGFGSKQNCTSITRSVGVQCNIQTDRLHPDLEKSKSFSFKSEQCIPSSSESGETETAVKEITETDGAVHVESHSKLMCSDQSSTTCLTMQGVSVTQSLTLQDSSSISTQSRTLEVNRSQSSHAFSSLVQRQHQDTPPGREEPYAGVKHYESNRRLFCSKTTTSEKLKEEECGSWTLTQIIKSRVSLPGNLVEQRIVSGQLPWTSQNAINRSGASLLAYLPESSSVSNTTYRFIKKNILWEVAKRLDHDGMMLIRELGVSDETITQAKAEYPSNLQERYLYCLQSWCKEFGSEANKDVLKNALRICKRNDLVALVDDLAMQPATC